MNRKAAPLVIALMVLAGFVIFVPRSASLSNTEAQLGASAQALHPSLSATPEYGPFPLTVWFTTGALPDTPLKDAYTLEFGDGTSKTLSARDGCAPSADSACVYSVSHLYREPGVYVTSMTQQYLCNGGASVCVAVVPNEQLLIVASGGSGATATISLYGGQVSQQGQIQMQWSTTNAPSDASLFLELYAKNGQDFGRIAGDLPLRGTYVWTLPDGSATSSPDGSVFQTPAGQYEIVATLLEPAPQSIAGTTFASAPSQQRLAVSSPAYLTITPLPTSPVR